MSDAERSTEARASDPSARIGAVVDKYTVVRVLGRGGMGAVYEARHARLSRRFAIKFLLPELAANREVLRRFENEAKAAGGLEHPNLAAVTDFGRASDGAPYIVMEFLQGEDCSKLLKRLGPLPVPRAVNIVAQACRGLAVAHQAGIVHRDLKPENLFLTDAGDGSDLLKVLDFGIAKLKVSDASVVTGTGATFGTAFYMSPEQARGAGEVDARTDVWSLGVVLYELLSGRRPFEGEQFLQVIHQILSVEPTSLGTLRPAVPAKLAAMVERAMAKDVAARIPSVMALAEALAPFSGGRMTGEAAAPVAAMAATAATPATSAPVAAVSSEPGVRSAARSPTEALAERPFPSKRSSKRMLGAVLLIVLAGGIAVLVLARRAPKQMTDPPKSTGMPMPAVFVQPSALAPFPNPAPAQRQSTRPLAVPAQLPSELFERRSDKRKAHKSAHRQVLPQAVEPLKAAPPPEAAPARHPVDIETESPYGP